MRIACIKHGTNELSIIAGRGHEDDRVPDDDGDEETTIEGCLDVLMATWAPRIK